MLTRSFQCLLLLLFFKKGKKIWINRFDCDRVPNQTKLMSAAYSARPVSLKQLDYAMNEISVSIKTETIKKTLKLCVEIQMPIVNRSSASFRTVILLLAFIKNSGVCIY
jgi:hypothetical protein